MNKWKQINHESEIDEIIAKSHEYPQIIFKDSVSCGISAYAKSRLLEGNQLMIEKAEFNYLDLLKFRSISNYISKVLNVIHQSPQVIVLRNGNVVHKDSHHSIHPEKIAKFL
jgi:bacillithiol system protein YtxJ